MPKVRIALTLSGAISLGAYEAGAVAALLVGVQALCDEAAPELRVDAVSGASAGALTGLLAVRILQAGLDPVPIMHAAWVQDSSLASMLTHDPHAPLSADGLRRNAVEFLDPHDERGQPAYCTGRRQLCPIQVHISLTCLRGLSYEIHRVGDHRPVQASTYIDWGRFTFQPDDDVKTAYLEPQGAAPVDFALASAAHIAGFPPRRLRRAQDRAAYDEHRVTNFPETGWLWYADGGILDNEPLAHTLDLTNAIDRDEPIREDDRRLHLVIHPLIMHPQTTEDAPGNSWADPARQPRWTATLVRVEMIQRVQRLYEHLRRLEKINTRLLWTARVKDDVRRLLDDLERRDPAASKAWQRTLRELLDGISKDKQIFSRHQSEGAPDAKASAADLLNAILDQITDTGSKDAVNVEVVSPLQLPEARSGSRVQSLLAGDMMGAFGGFLDEGLRLHDFLLGYRSMLAWMERDLEPQGLSADAANRAVAAVRAHMPPQPVRDYGAANFLSLSWREQTIFYRMAAHVLRVLLHESVVDAMADRARVFYGKLLGWAAGRSHKGAQTSGRHDMSAHAGSDAQSAAAAGAMPQQANGH